MDCRALRHFRPRAILRRFYHGRPASLSGMPRQLNLLMELCTLLGLPMAADKLEGPTTCLIFLGVELDNINLKMRLPAEKLARLKIMLRKWAHLLSCRKRELQLLVGLLHDASIVVTPGRTFLRRLIDLIKSAHHRPGSIFLRLNREARSDILW